MTKRKSKAQENGKTNGTDPNTSTEMSTALQQPGPAAKQTRPKMSEPALIICRNKHWRYISAFHGPWLQLPPELLESFAYYNYYFPRPQVIDPAVFFDLVKIRRLVEEATSLAVRAANGTTSSALQNSINASNGIFSGGSAAALGLGIGGGGTNAKLSRERKHRMRENATQKLSKAYHLDEIAASVATMQSASSLELVAKHVLDRSPDDPDAKYVHFFHEKIPSRMLAECTDLKPLDDVIVAGPFQSDVAAYRTRALTKIFKEDFAGAAADLTSGLGQYRMLAQHRAIKEEEMALALKSQARDPNARYEQPKLTDEDQPSSMEIQLLFHRAGTYLTIAVRHIDDALNVLKPAQETQNTTERSPPSGIEKPPIQSFKEKEAARHRAEARKIVKTCAKRALRDYIAYLSHFSYSPEYPSELLEEFFRRYHELTVGGINITRRNHSNSRLLDQSNNPCQPTDNSLVPRQQINHSSHYNSHSYSHAPNYPLHIQAHPVNTLFSPSPPANLPPYPTSSQALIPKSKAPLPESAHPLIEHLTYHPLITDALHSLLLCHALIQTSPKELLRHAHMVARLTRITDGSPIFLPARSPARADWIEIVRRANNWLNLQQSWETLCEKRPPPASGRAGGGYGPGSLMREETEEERKERRKHEVIMEALADERVQDEESFQAALRARERRAEELRKEESGDGGGGAGGRGGWASQEDAKEYPISTERAEAVARWVREAPIVPGEGRGKKKGKGKKKSTTTTATTATTGGIKNTPVPPDLEPSTRSLEAGGGKGGGNCDTTAEGRGMRLDDEPD